MENRKKALLLSGVASITILCGCVNCPPKVVEREEGIYLTIDDEEYQKVELSPVVYEPGTHIIKFNQYYVGKTGYDGIDGWETSPIDIPEPPEGYRYVETITIDKGNQGTLAALVHVYVNYKTVEVTPIYNVKKNVVDFCYPGTVVEEKVLKIGD